MFPFVSNPGEVETRPQHHWSRRASSVCVAAACASFQVVARQRNAVRPSGCESPLTPGTAETGRESRQGGGGGRVSSAAWKFLAGKRGRQE